MNRETTERIRARLQGIEDDEEILDVIFEELVLGFVLRVKTVKIVRLPCILAKPVVRSEWHRPRPIILHGIHTKPLSKLLTEEDPEEELLVCFPDQGELKANRGSSPHTLGYEKHTHTPTHMGEGYTSTKPPCRI